LFFLWISVFADNPGGIRIVAGSGHLILSVHYGSSLPESAGIAEWTNFGENGIISRQAGLGNRTEKKRGETDMEHTEGIDKGQITLYALSTCVWCTRTKSLLQKLGVAYDYVYVDNLAVDDRGKTMEEIKHWNPKCSFPSLVINNSQCIVGFDEKKIREAIG
jgi:glutaredoxin-like protein NrdH